MPDTYIHGFSPAEQARLLEQAQVLAPAVFGGLNLDGCRTLLEIGCGVGAQTRQLLARWPDLKIIAIDRSPTHLAAAAVTLRDEIAAGRVTLLRATAEDLPLASASFDAAITIWVLEHVPRPDAVVAEAARLLRPGGRLVLTEVDNGTFGFFPRNEVIEGWWAKFNRFQQQGGADPFVGARTEQLARDAGFAQLSHEFLPVVSSRQEPGRRLELLRYTRDLLLSGADNLRQAGLVDAAEEARLRTEFERLESRPEVDFQYLAVRVCAVRPVMGR